MRLRRGSIVFVFTDSVVTCSLAKLQQKT